MSRPTIEISENPINREQSVNDLIESVALMETGLSHIINAEGEKIQKVINLESGADVPINDILNVNDSVTKMVNSVSKLEMILQNKLDTSKELDQSGNTESNMGTIIPYAGQAHLTNNQDGTPLFGAGMAFQSDGSEAFRVNLEGNAEQINLQNSIATYPISRDGIIDSISVFYDVPMFQSMYTDTQIIARVYQAEINSSIYYPIEKAIVYLEPIIPAFSTNGMIVSGIVNNINAQVKTNSKILLLIYAVAGYDADVRGEIGASINIK